MKNYALMVLSTFLLSCTVIYSGDGDGDISLQQHEISHVTTGQNVNEEETNDIVQEDTQIIEEILEVVQ